MICPHCSRRYGVGNRFCAYDGTLLVVRLPMESLRCKRTFEQGRIWGDRYEVYGSIGKGAMARVYLAQDRITKEPVAIKVLEAVHAMTSRVVERFLRESQAAKRIDHPHVVKILDAGERPDGAPYIVMEYLFGESLGEWLRRIGRMDAELAIPVFRQVASALAAAHQAGIVHRDVKPDNIFLVGAIGDPYAVKVLDFGFAKLHDRAGVTGGGVAVGTLGYMAPEQVVSDPPDARTDVYALGIVMFRLLTGEPPFPHTDDGELLAHQLISKPPRPSEKYAVLDHAIEAIVLKAIQKHPDNRYSSMTALIEDLERLSGNEHTDILVHEPVSPAVDIYLPQTDYAKHVLPFFYKRLNRAPPNFGQKS